jgi:hypothetical protein
LIHLDLLEFVRRMMFEEMFRACETKGVNRKYTDQNSAKKITTYKIPNLWPKLTKVGQKN